MTTKLVSEKHIEEMMLDAQVSTDPSVRGEEVDLEDGVKGKMDVEHPGRVFVYDQRDGERSEVLAHPDYLRAQLLKTDRDPASPHFGKRIFTTVKPLITPFRGVSLCPLHKDHPDSSAYRSLGLRPCRKSNLLNEREALSHLKLKHKREFETIESERQRKIQDEERELRRLNIESLSRAFGPAPKEVPEAAPAITPTGAAFPVSVPCPDCGIELTAKNRGGINLKMKAHRTKLHTKE